MEKQKYYIGLDMGTNSVGWAVTDPAYKVIRKKGKDLWGIREFDEASTAADRRMHRISRRRRQREQVRIGMLKEYFADAINAVDSNFYQRLENSKYYEEDKDENVKSPNGVFADKNYKDSDYFKEYPTIFHLRKELIENREAHDVRLVYLAILNMFKHRGHFLNMGISGERSSRTITEVFDEFRFIFSDLIEENNSINSICGDELESILSSRDISRSGKAEIISAKLNITKKDKEKTEAIRAICGLKFSVSKILKMDSEEKLELDFSSISYEEKVLEIQNKLGDDAFKLIELMKEIYDIGMLSSILKGQSYLSFARCLDYEKHKEDLKKLKRVVKTYLSQADYDFLFRSDNEGSYSAYVNSTNSDGFGIRQRRDMKKRKAEDFYATVKRKLKDIVDEDANQILIEIANDTFMPKQLTASNGVIPNQVHLAELRAILDNAKNYLQFLNDVDESGYSIKDRIIMLFTFQIPYYVGPVSVHSENSNGWVVRKDTGTVLPWNIESKIDMKKTSEAFISRMVRSCSYLNGEQSLPQNSLLYEKYMVLNEINNIKIDREPISVELKQKIYNELLKKGKKITKTRLAKYLANYGIKVTTENLTGVDENIHSTLANYAKFKSILGDMIDTDAGLEMVESIIFWCTVYGESKKYLKEQLLLHYANKLTEEQIKRISSLKLKDWGRLSRAMLTLTGVDKQTGEVMSIIEAMWTTNMSFMELINSGLYNFKELLEEKNSQALKTLCEFKPEDLGDYYFSAPVRKMVWQTLLIIKEIEKVMGTSPERVFIEMTRSEGEKGKRIDSRKQQLTTLYKGIKDTTRDWIGLIEEADQNGKLKSKKMYLYLLQMGKDMYTGKPIELSDLFNDNLYDIDHIYPRHFVKDDNINNNLVLVNKSANNHKSDEYPLERTILSNENVRALWKTLKEKKLITEEKYRRLTGVTQLSDTEKADFIARQLVETSQGTKGVADILKHLLPDTTIIYSKATNVSEFRNGNNGSNSKNSPHVETVKFPKVRAINDLHHAYDAYLNIVVGNVYYTKFTQNPANFIEAYKRDEKKNHYNLSRMFDWDVERNGYQAWSAGAEGTIKTVKDMLSKNTPIMTRLSFEGTGEIANQTLYSKRKAKKEGYIPLKFLDDKMQDVTKYGGFSSVSTAYFFLVEHDVKKKTCSHD